jgi:hypothetical protein
MWVHDQRLVGWARPVCRTNRTVGCDEPGPCGRTRPTRGFASRRLAWVSCVPAAARVAAAPEGASSIIGDPWRSGSITVPAAMVTNHRPRVPSFAPSKRGPGSPHLQLADEQASGSGPAWSRTPRHHRMPVTRACHQALRVKAVYLRERVRHEALARRRRGTGRGRGSGSTLRRR